MDNYVRLLKYSAPTKYDKASYGTIWEDHKDDQRQDYIQLNKDENDPHWETVGKFLEYTHHDNLYKQGFLRDALMLYQGSNHAATNRAKTTSLEELRSSGQILKEE